MPLIRTTRSNLLGGVSQQPHSTRLDSQCEAQDDAYSSVIDGLIKRHPTQLVKRLAIGGDAGFSANVFESNKFHFVDRSPTERYVMMFGNDGTSPENLRIFDASDGTEMTVRAAGGGPLGSTPATYLAGCTEFLQLRDTTYAVNPTYTPVMNTSLLSDAFDINGGQSTAVYQAASARRKFIFIRSTNYLRRFAVRLVLEDKFGVNTPRNGFKGQKALNEAWVKTFDGNSSPATGTGYAALYPQKGENEVPPFVLDGPFVQNINERGAQIGTIEPSEVLARLWDQAGLPLLQSGTPPADDPGISYLGGIRAVYNRETGNDASNARGLANGAPGVLTEDLNDILTRGLGFDNSAASGSSQTPQTRPPMGGGVMMLEPLPSRNAVQHASAFVLNIHLDVVDSGGGQAGDMIVFGDSIESFSDLPLYCRDGHIVKVGAEGDTPAHYVKFNSDEDETILLDPYRDDLKQGQWEESIGHLQEYEIDADFMPHKIVRVEDTGEPNGYAFEVSTESWDDRLAGDSTSNPDPAFIGSTIQSIFFWRNRLGFICGNGKIVMSESGSFTNFWRTTVITTPESDPIEVEVPSRQGGAPRYAVPQADSLIVFADQQQFVLTGEPILTPESVTIRQVSEYDTFYDVRPVAADTGIFWAYPGPVGDFTQIGQLNRVGDSQLYDRFEATAQCPRYIKGRLEEMVANTAINVLVTRSEALAASNSLDESANLYVYKWFQSGNQRVLSSWFRFRIGPEADATGAYSTKITRVVGMGFFDNDLYLIIKRCSETATDNYMQLTMERMRLGELYQDSDSNYLTCLDQRITDAECDVSYLFGSRRMQITLPYLVSNATSGADNIGGFQKPWVVTRAATGTTTPEGQVLNNEELSESASGVASPRGHTLLITDTDKSLYDAYVGGTLKFWVGTQYDMSYQFSRFSLRGEQGPQGSTGEVNVGRYRIRYLALGFARSGYFEVRVTPEVREDGTTAVVNRDTVVLPLPQMEVGVGASWLGNTNIRDGTMKVPILTEPRAVRVFLENSTPFPSNVKTVEIVGEYNSRAQSLFR